MAILSDKDSEQVDEGANESVEKIFDQTQTKNEQEG